MTKNVWSYYVGVNVHDADGDGRGRNVDSAIFAARNIFTIFYLTTFAPDFTLRHFYYF